MAIDEPSGDTNPFLPPESERDALRRFRGRLTAPVTIVTAGDTDNRTGLTISSVFVAEGEPPVAYFLLGSTSDLYYAIEDTGKFVIHVCAAEHRGLADVFAGLRPSPGGLFAGQPTTQTEYGPMIDGIGNRAFCTYRSGDEDSYSVIVVATVDRIDISELNDPLAYFRGRYRALD